MDGACEIWKTRCFDHKKWHWFFLSSSCLQMRCQTCKMRCQTFKMRCQTCKMRCQTCETRRHTCKMRVYYPNTLCPWKHVHTSFWCNSHEVHVARWIVFSLILQENDWNQVKTEDMNVTTMQTDPLNVHPLSVETDGREGETGWRKKFFGDL